MYSEPYGKTWRITLKNINPKDKNQLMGRTRTNRLTFFPKVGPNNNSYKVGDLVKVKIDEIRSFSLTGTPLA